MRKIEKDIIDNFFLLLFILISVSGVLMGSIAVNKTPEALNLLKEAESVSGGLLKTFISAFSSELFFILLAALGGLSLFLAPLLLISVYLKAYSYGFTAGCIVALSGFEGLLKIGLGLFLQNFIFCGALSIYASFGLSKSISSYLNRRNYDFVKRKNISFLKATAFIIIISLIISAFEAFIALKTTIYTL